MVRWESVPRGSFFARTWKLTFVPPFLPTRLTAPGSPRIVSGQHLVKTSKKKAYFQMRLCASVSSQCRGKILFVIKLQTSKQQDTPNFRSAILHWRNRPIKMWETHPNDYWVFSKMVDLLSLIPRSYTFQDAGWVNFPPWGRSGCQIPYPRAYASETHNLPEKQLRRAWKRHWEGSRKCNGGSSS